MNPIIKCFRHFTNWRWEIGIVDNSLDGIVKGEKLSVHWLKLPFSNRWFADPFILEVSDREIVLLVEEYCDSLKKGRIAKVIINRDNYSLVSWKIILELPTHLSFPAIIRKDKQVYIYPENSASGKLLLYEYDPITDEIILSKEIAEEPLTDTIYTELFASRKLIFSTQLPNPNSKQLDIREWREEISKYIRIGEIVFKEKTGRMAGDFFKIGDNIYRPAQESNVTYGHSVEIQKIEIYEDNKWKVTPIRRMTSPHPVLKLGFHTFNSYKGLSVIDVKGFRYPILGSLLVKIFKIFRIRFQKRQ